MAQYRNAVMTQNGAALLNKAQAGLCKIEFTRMSTGDGTFSESEKSPEELRKMTDLKSHKQSFAFDSIKYRDDTTVELKASITNHNDTQTLSEGYYIQEIAVFAREAGEEDTEILYSIAVADSPDFMPPYNGKNPMLIIQRYYVTVDDSKSAFTVPSHYGADLEAAKQEVEKVLKEYFDEVYRKTIEHIDTHLADKNNPHEVTKAQVGLGNADDTPDVSKPVSTAQQKAIDEAYANSNYYTDEKIAALIDGAPSTLDTLKEIADAMKEHEDVVKALDEAIGTKASEKEFTSHVNDTSNPHGVTKEQLGLGEAENTSDANKPISKATQKALDDINSKLSVVQNSNAIKNSAVNSYVKSDGSFGNIEYDLSKIGTMKTDIYKNNEYKDKTISEILALMPANATWYIPYITQCADSTAIQGLGFSQYSTIRLIKSDDWSETVVVTGINGFPFGIWHGNKNTTNIPGSLYVYDPSNFSVNYANASGKINRGDYNKVTLRSYKGTPSSGANKDGGVFLQSDFTNNYVIVGIDGLGEMGVNRATNDSGGWNIHNYFLPETVIHLMSTEERKHIYGQTVKEVTYV